MNISQSVCHSCKTSITEPFILCSDCPNRVTICLPCFAKGRTFDAHQNNHSYEVVRLDFILFEPKWTAAEEIRLLQAVNDCGIGNWHDVSGKVRTKTGSQCQKHYTKCYITDPVKPLPDVRPVTLASAFNRSFSAVCDDPPRPSEGSSTYQDMSGYMPARGDFLTEFCNFAENELSDIEFNKLDQEFDRKLKFAVVDIYNNVLRERFKRKRIIRDHGLINIKHHNCESHSFMHPRLLEQLRVFMQLSQPEDWEKQMQALNYEAELRSCIRQLQQYRAAGIQHLSSAKIYNKLLQRRQEEMSFRSGHRSIMQSAQSDALCEDWLNKNNVFDRIQRGIPVSAHPPVRKPAPPLQISGLPAFEKLNESERKLCSSVRLVPESYLEFKKILTNECCKHGYLRLATARTLIKIDVNKTRKLYDFLLKQKLISKDPPNEKVREILK
ncbi:hypothetical protein CAPTEDRAFT_132232 [Capitella teleta]|uniref:Transcriptional adapter n=1 Tax=Capitella teleta TaxID=283909 RepID=R7UMZ5_CAPTE|nr:hypothetical protein CAPTEDRAFT_132232 [Capitella teleta]|eukprot:ELU07914.1 hypothetical protein CAPTEDRAFT_132232 [Capitella teleta]